MKVCVFAGTFDPFSNGHEDVVKRCLEMFDKVVVAIGDNQEKSPLFNIKDRVKFVEKVFYGNDKVEVCCFKGLLVDFMKEKGIRFNVRGIRDVEDYKYETLMVNYNEDLYPEIITIYLPTNKKFNYVSSTAIRNLIGLDADFSQYVPKVIYQDVKDVYATKGKKK